MAVLSFTPGDALQTIVMEAGIYSAELTKIEGPKASSSGKSNNFFVAFTVTSEGKYKGKELEIILNTETNNASILGTAQFFPTNILLQIDAAIRAIKVEPINVDIDTENLLHKPLDLAVAVTTADGKLINIINNFLPKGSAGAQPSW